MLHHNNVPFTQQSPSKFLAGYKHFSGSSVPLFAVSQSLYLILLHLLKNNLEGRHYGTFDNIQIA
jgi:hypothetical protein